jgi:hypothetical protein
LPGGLRASDRRVAVHGFVAAVEKGVTDVTAD